MAASDIVCAVCGASNQAKAARCVSCGAKLDALGPTEYTDDELYARRNQQEGFEWKWAIVSFVTNLLLQGVVLVGLPFVVPAYDPEGIAGIFISIGLWFVGGVVVGFLSPGKTFLEPAVGSLLTVPPTILYLLSITRVYQTSIVAYIIGGLIGVMVALFGAFVGEKMQGGSRRPAPRPTARSK